MDRRAAKLLSKLTRASKALDFARKVSQATADEVRRTTQALEHAKADVQLLDTAVKQKRRRR